MRRENMLRQNFVIDLISGLAVGSFIGYFLDGVFSSSPWMLFICAIFGTAGGFYSSYKDLIREIKKEEDKNKDA
jgi:F0F1-type ATP synthase assembly protein I